MGSRLLISQWDVEAAYSGLRWECKRCGACCMRFRVDLNIEDLLVLGDGSCVDYYIDHRFWPHMRSGEVCEHLGCMFLCREKDTYSCSIYEKRPMSCRIYPFSILPVERAYARGIEFDPTATAEIDDKLFVVLYDLHCTGIGNGPPANLVEAATQCHRSILSFMRMKIMPTWEIYQKLSTICDR